MDTPLFQTNTKYTFEEYKKCSLSTPVMSRIKKLTILCSSLFIIFALIRLSQNKIVDMISNIITAIFIPLFLKISYNFLIKLAYNSDKNIQNADTKIIFYDTYVEHSNEFMLIKLRYDNIYRIVETKTNFYIMASRIFVLNIIKKNCSSELISFIKNLKAQQNTK